MDVFIQNNFTGFSVGLEEVLSDTGVSYADTAGSGVVTINDSVGSAGMLRSEDALLWSYRLKIKYIPVETMGYLGAIVAGSAPPEIDAKADFDDTRRIWAWCNGFNTLHLCVKDYAGDVRTWDGGAWSDETVECSVADFDQTGVYRLVIKKDIENKVRMYLYDDDDALLEETDPIETWGANVNEETYFIAGYPYNDEPFTSGYGFDGKQIEPCYYRLTGDTEYLSIDDKVVFDCDGDAVESLLTFNDAVNIEGDFDVQIDFDQTTLDGGAVPARRLEFKMFSASNSSNYITVFKYKTSTLERYYFRVYVDDIQQYSFSVNIADSSGKLRLVREDDTVRGYYWNGAAWVQLGVDYDDWDTSDVYPALYFKSNAAANVFEIDNLTLNTGTVKLLSRSSKYSVVSGINIEREMPEFDIVHRIFGTETSPTVNWGGDSLEVVYAIRRQYDSDIQIVNRIGEAYGSEDLSVIYAIGESVAAEMSSWEVYLDGEDITNKVKRVELASNIDSVPNTCRIDIADEILYMIKAMYKRSDVNFYEPRIDIYIDDLLYDSYFWDDLNMSEKPRETTWQIWGRNSACLLFYPYATKTTKVWETSTRKAIIEEIVTACGLTLDYQVIDFAIPGGLLEVESEYPMNIIRTLAEIDGAYVRSGGDQTIVVKYKEYAEVGESVSGESSALAYLLGESADSSLDYLLGET